MREGPAGERTVNRRYRGRRGSMSIGSGSRSDRAPPELVLRKTQSPSQWCSRCFSCSSVGRCWETLECRFLGGLLSRTRVCATMQRYGTVDWNPSRACDARQVSGPDPDCVKTQRLRDNRRMTDAAHNQHLETRRSDRSRPHRNKRTQPFPARPSRSVALR
jgi:hypothetical protein